MAPPPWFTIAGISWRRHSHTPLRLMEMTRSQFSSVQSAVGALLPSMPALLNATSSRPKFSIAWFTALSTSAGFDTSVLTNMASPPAFLIAWAASSPSLTRTSARTTLAPSRAKASAVARPIPAAAPVTRATLPLNFPAITSSLTWSRRSCRSAGSSPSAPGLLGLPKAGTFCPRPDGPVSPRPA